MPETGTAELWQEIRIKKRIDLAFFPLVFIPLTCSLLMYFTCVTLGLAYSFSTNIYTRKLGSCSCKLNIVTQVHHQAFLLYQTAPDAYGNI